jgi:isoleucyl-tRNA synthetase
VRLPLSEVTVVAADAESLADFAALIADEVNVRDVTLLDVADAAAKEVPVTQRLTINPRAVGPRLGKEVQKVIKASKSGDWSVDTSGRVVCGGIELQRGEFTLETVVAEGADATTAMLPGGGFVVLNTTVTPELEAEGLARDVVRVVQQARRAADLGVSDRITLTIAGTAAAQEAIRTYQALIATETLADSVETVEAAALDGDPQAGEPSVVGDDETIRVRLTA